EGLMLEKSFHSVGLTEILEAVKVPKGSFYHHFESKEQFGVELLKHYVADATAYKKEMLLSPTPEPDPLRRLLSFCEGCICRVLETKGKCSCLVLKLAAEVADMSEAMREVLAAGNREWIAILEQLLQEGVEKKKIAKTVIPAEMAPIIHDLWNGAMQRSAVCRDATPPREALAFITTQLTP
ncbi:MAG: TetR/AcrR family transcriptional regulator, partial [Prosthecobacter sp.]|nr:TetR/AcrR family transcriptional regulator [Prosthecobacter sp.]